MASPNILSFNYSDNQQEIVRKLNYNFDEICEADGGVQGPLGATGATGLIGLIGPIGSTGLTGPRGTRWFVGGTESPTGGYGDIVVEGDYWIDTLGVDKPLYVFGPSGWINTGFNLIPEDEFTLITGLISATGGTSSYRAVVQSSSLPSQNTFVLSDGTPSVDLTNPDYTNFLITTDPSVNDYPILEFSRGESSIVGASGYFRHPIFRWTGGDNDYNLIFTVPSDRLTLLTGAGITASTPGNFNLQADDMISISTPGNVIINNSGPSYFNTISSLGITAGNINLDSTSLVTDLDLKIQTIPGKSPNADPIYGNYSLWIENPSGTSLFLGATGGATSGNELISARKNGVNLMEARTDGVVYVKKNSIYSHVPSFDNTNSINVSYGGGLIISWYYIDVTTLGYNNCFILDVNPANDLGVALNVRNGDSQNVLNLLENYQSMRIKVLSKTNLSERKIKYLGYFTGSPPASNQYVSFPDGINQADLLITRGQNISSSASKILYKTNTRSGRLL